MHAWKYDNALVKARQVLLPGSYSDNFMIAAFLRNQLSSFTTIVWPRLNSYSVSRRTSGFVDENIVCTIDFKMFCDIKL